MPVAVGPAEVYSSVDADTVLTVLTHKITKAVRTQVGSWDSLNMGSTGHNTGVVYKTRQNPVAYSEALQITIATLSSARSF